MSDTLWLLILAQIAMGGFDTLFHHEGTEQLAWRPSQRIELRLHGVRNLLYAIMFAMLGWTEPGGVLALVFIALLGAELIITLWDFVEEDRTRKLPATERVTHTLLTLNYGVILALLGPLLLGWSERPTGIAAAYHGVWSWLCVLAALATFVFGLRDLAAAQRAARLGDTPAAELAGELEARRAVLVTGGSGFIGTRLIAALIAAGHDVTVLTRRRETAAHLPAPVRIVTDLRQISSGDRIDAIVNLAGEPISNGLWTASKRRRIIDSRRIVTLAVGELISRLARKPEVLVNGSAIGWYGLRGNEPLDEEAAPQACFSHEICSAWEETAAQAADGAVRLVLLRIGLVLGRQGGVLGRMLAPFEFGVGGPFGNGQQVMSWIHRDDLVRLIVNCIADPRLAGPVNGTAPEPVSNRQFARQLGAVLGRPALLAMPAMPLKLALGAFADELLLGGQRVLPVKATEAGFHFNYPTLEAAMREITGWRARGTTAPEAHRGGGRPRRVGLSALES